jgi:hypothetical protein
VTERERVLLLVRRARARLEAARLLKGAARGALAGAALGLPALLLGKLFPPAAPVLPWALVLAGAGAGLLVALLRPGIGLPAAALYLDGRLGTKERFATVATRPRDPLLDRVAAELAPFRRLPRSPVPKELGLVPMALFLLFAAGLLPARAARELGTAPSFAVVPLPGDAGAGTAEDAAAAIGKLVRGQPPAPEEAAAVRESVERLRSPEERKAARAALERALAGERAAAEAVEEALRPRAPAEDSGAALQPSAYPEAEAFVREYRRVLEEDRQ